MYLFWIQDKIVHHYFMDGAVHVCQTMGVCDAMARRLETSFRIPTKKFLFSPDTPAKSASRGWTGCRCTWRTRSWLQSSPSISSKTIALVRGSLFGGKLYKLDHIVLICPRPFFVVFFLHNQELQKNMGQPNIFQCINLYFCTFVML